MRPGRRILVLRNPSDSLLWQRGLVQMECLPPNTAPSVASQAGRSRRKLAARWRPLRPVRRPLGRDLSEHLRAGSVLPAFADLRTERVVNDRGARGPLV